MGSRSGASSCLELCEDEPQLLQEQVLPPDVIELSADEMFWEPPTADTPGFCHLKLFDEGTPGWLELSQPQYSYIHVALLMEAVKYFGGRRSAYLSYTPECHCYHVELGWGDILLECSGVLNLDREKRVGALISEVVATGVHLSERALAFARFCMEETNDVAEDAVNNYARIGEILNDTAAKGGLVEMGRSSVLTVLTAVIGRWTGKREAAAVARCAADAAMGDGPWDSAVITDVLEDEDGTEEEKEARLASIMGTFLVRKIGSHWSGYVGRSHLRAWRATFLGTSRGFARVLGVDQHAMEKHVGEALNCGMEIVESAAKLLKTHGMTAAAVAAKVAAGAAVTAGLVIAAGLVLDWWYDDVETKRLGCTRETVGPEQEGWYVSRAGQLAAIAGVLSDEAYALSSHPNTVRVDPFFFYVRRDVGMMKEETDAERLLVGTMINPLIATANNKHKNVILVPATISHDSMMHIQSAMPQFYYRVVDRHHSHPELWLVRRIFEMMTSQRLACKAKPDPTILVGGSVRQASKFPRVVANFGPVMTGRDESRRRLEGTAGQQAFYNAVTRPKAFTAGATDCYPGGIAVAPFSAQDMSKRDFLKACIAHGVSEAHVYINVPILLLDGRLDTWDDPVLNVRYNKKGGKLFMASMGMAVNGYANNFETVMSWVKPFAPIPGYDAVVEVVGQVSSCYNIMIKIGIGTQEEHMTVWRMPDAGHYVLQDLTREEEGLKFFSTPAFKFDQVVKFLFQQVKAAGELESAAGRVVGLESPIKLGMVTLERAWDLDHRQFASVVVHAVCCAGLDKSDARASLKSLEKFFSRVAKDERTFFGRVWHGWEKALGLVKDERWIHRLRYGKSDYDPVTHWTMYQSPGEPHLYGSEPPFLETEAVLTAGGTSGGSGKTGKTVPDEGYVSGEQTSSDTESEPPASTEYRSAVPVKPDKGKRKTETPVRLESLRAIEESERVIVTDEDYANYHTGSIFQPEVTALPPDDQSSRAHLRYWELRDTFSCLDEMVSRCRTIPCPDSGAVELMQSCWNQSEKSLTLSGTSLDGPWPVAPETEVLAKYVNSFYDAVEPQRSVRAPVMILDGIAGSAKSSCVRKFCRVKNLRASVVVPSRRLKKDWVATKVGRVVTRHGLTKAKLASAGVLIIDEVYAYEHSELGAYLCLAETCKVPVILLGDREQQYVDGNEMSTDVLNSLGCPTVRFWVSNTMPVDTCVVADTAFRDRDDMDLLQTRSCVRNSIFFVAHDSPAFDAFKVSAGYSNTLAFKDRVDTPLGWVTPTNDFGLGDGPEEWNSVSRVQGVRTEYAALLSSKATKTERFFGEQRGLLYVAVTRHSLGMLFACYRSDLSKIRVPTEPWTRVDGRLAKKAARERFDAPFSIRILNPRTESPVLSLLYSRGAVPQAYRCKTLGPICDDWRPWIRIQKPEVSIVEAVARYGALQLRGSREPFANTAAARMPVFAAAKGLSSLRRPVAVPFEEVDSVFPGLDRLAVRQTSKDEVLDLKNVVERTARPRTLDRTSTESKARILFERTMGAFFDLTEAKDWSVEPSAEEWLETRSADYIRKFERSTPFLSDKASTVSDGFLKTQTKVKVSASFALEENYGQTVLATPADYNAIFGPWSKMYLRNIRLAARKGVIIDSGYSDKELAREWRKLGVLARLADHNFQADVSRQDTSHTPVTLAVFCMRLRFFGVPEDVVELYRRHSESYEYRSIAPGLYRGKADHNLGSGDPFTLIRNIDEVMVVMVERYNWKQIATSCAAIKGDDWLSDRSYDLVPSIDGDVRKTVLKTAVDMPPYHAGRFFLTDDVVPDPIRMVVKAFVKRTDKKDRANELAEAFYDRYLPVQSNRYDELLTYCQRTYADFDRGFVRSLVDLYGALADRNLFFDLVTTLPPEDRLVVLDAKEGCSAFAVSWFTDDVHVLDQAAHVDARGLQQLCRDVKIPCFRIMGRPGDFLKRGIWYSNTHAQVVLGLTEYNQHARLANPETDACIDVESWFGDFEYPGLRLVSPGGLRSGLTEASASGGHREIRGGGGRLSGGESSSQLVASESAGAGPTQEPKRDRAKRQNGLHGV